MEQLEATVIGITFRNDENGYTVMTVREGAQTHTVVGTLPELQKGERIQLTGEWMDHPQYGTQFKCSTCQIQQPTTPDGIEAFLGSGVIKGIRTAMAHMIVAHFGEETLSVLNEHPERLREIPGIGKKKCAEIAESYAKLQGAREALMYLQSYGITPHLAQKITKRYGNDAPARIRENPYRLCDDIEGVGFRTADRIGASMGVPPESESRLQCALNFILQESANTQGHVYLPYEALAGQASMMLNVPRALCEREISAMLLNHRLTGRRREDEQLIYLPAFDRAEREVALRLQELKLSCPSFKDTKAEQKIAAFEKKNHIRFSITQRAAMIRCLETGVFIITGGPGTGKTTIINCILHLLKQAGTKVLLCAPTGRAAKRMTEATGEDSQTIHRLLSFDPESGTFSHDASDPLEADCLIVDEASMIDLMLMRALLRATAPGTRLIIVGDADQLPSVGPGHVLGDILKSGKISCAHLTDIYRQSESSRIIVNAHRINHGELPLLNEKGTDFFFERKTSYREAADTIVDLVSRRLPAYLKCPGNPSAQIQVLSPTKKGECGVLELNYLLQARLNPPAPHKPEILCNDIRYRPGDKVIHTKNDYDLAWTQETNHHITEGTGIFNGDMGIVEDVDEGEGLTVLFDDGKRVYYEIGDLDHLDLAYCLSVHKSQGSEFRAVVMPVVGGPPMLLTRNLFYTALTRARELVVLVGREETIAQMTANQHEQKRYTSLDERIQEASGLGEGPC